MRFRTFTRLRQPWRLAVAALSSDSGGAPHAILGVSHDASPATVKTAFKRLALKLHPDIPGSGCEVRYREARGAMEAMLLRSSAPRAGASSHGPSWARARRADADAADAEDEDPELEREYAEMMRRRAAQDQRESAEERAWFMRGFRVLCIYVFVGAVVKYGILRAVAEVRERGWADSWIEPVDVRPYSGTRSAAPPASEVERSKGAAAR